MDKRDRALKLMNDFMCHPPGVEPLQIINDKYWLKKIADQCVEIAELESQLQLIEKMKKMRMFDLWLYWDKFVHKFKNDSSLYTVLESYLKETKQ